MYEEETEIKIEENKNENLEENNDKPFVNIENVDKMPIINEQENKDLNLENNNSQKEITEEENNSISSNEESSSYSKKEKLVPISSEMISFSFSLKRRLSQAVKKLIIRQRRRDNVKRIFDLFLLIEKSFILLPPCLES